MRDSYRSLSEMRVGGLSLIIHGLIFVVHWDVYSRDNRTEGYFKEEAGREVREAKQLYSHPKSPSYTLYPSGLGERSRHILHAPHRRVVMRVKV